MRLVPRNKKSITHSKRSSMIRCKIVKIEHTPRQGSINMSHNLPLKILLGLELMETITLPQSSGFGGDTRSEDLDFLLSVAGWGAGVVTRTDWDARLWERRDTHCCLEMVDED